MALMTAYSSLRQSIVAAVCALFVTAAPLAAENEVADLLKSLKSAEAAEAKRLDHQIRSIWSRSGSASMDLLLRRGRDALEENDNGVAVEHFTALTDHAPDFAEGWHALARAYFASDLYGPALDALGRAIALNPDHYPSIFGLGAMFQEFGDYARAETAFRRVLDLNPHHEDAQEALELLQRQGIGRTL